MAIKSMKMVNSMVLMNINKHMMHIVLKYSLTAQLLNKSVMSPRNHNLKL